MSDQQLAEELHKPIVWKIKKRKVQSPKIDNIWVADFSVMQLISKFNKGIRFFFCVTDVHNNNAWVIPLKDKKVITITNAFKKGLKESDRKPNKIWVDKGSEFYNRSMKSWLWKNDVEMYSSHQKVKSVVAERSIRILKNKIYEYITYLQMQFQKMFILIN